MLNLLFLVIAIHMVSSTTLIHKQCENKAMQATLSFLSICTSLNNSTNHKEFYDYSYILHQVEFILELLDDSVCDDYYMQNITCFNISTEDLKAYKSVGNIIKNVLDLVDYYGYDSIFRNVSAETKRDFIRSTKREQFLEFSNKVQSPMRHFYNKKMTLIYRKVDKCDNFNDWLFVEQTDVIIERIIDFYNSFENWLRSLK